MLTGRLAAPSGVLTGRVGLALPRLFLCAAIAGLGLFAAMPASAEPACRDAMPDEAADARGSTFIGTVINIRVIQREYTARLISFDVERVYAGGSVRAMPGIGLPRQELAAGKSATLYANPCDGIRGLRVGDSALVSTADLDDPQTWTSAVWRLSDGRAKLIRMAEALGDVRLEEADTVERALALVAPGALSMPDTSTAARTEPRARLRI